MPRIGNTEIERVRRFKNFTIKALRKPWKRDGSISMKSLMVESRYRLSMNMPMLIMLSKHLQEI